MHAKLTEAIFVILSKTWMMIVEIKNFGPIESFTFDLNKDLHFIIGENGVGKSYASYCLYCVLKNIDRSPLANLNETDLNDLIRAKAEEYYLQLQSLSEKDFIDLTEDFGQILKMALSKAFIPNLNKSLANTFTNLSNTINQFSKEPYSIKIENNDFEILIASTEQGGAIMNHCKIKDQIRLYKELKKKNDFYIEVNRQKMPIVSDNYSFKETPEQFWVGILSCLRIYYGDLQGIFRDYHRELLFLPASRSGLYQGLSALTPAIVALSQHRDLLPNLNLLPTLTEPVSDYFLHLSSINPSTINADLSLWVVSELEKDILKGEIQYDKNNNLIWFRPYDAPSLKLTLSDASSMIVELAPVVLFLRHIVSNQTIGEVNETPILPNAKKSVLFIEEPEAHVHPQLQIKFMEIIAKLIDFDIKVVLTSHSDYMFHMLNNMILDRKIDYKLVGAYHLTMTPRGSVVNPEGKATEEGIMDGNFAKSAESLFEERMEILDRQNSIV